jgi:hypothetical protein
MDENNQTLIRKAYIAILSDTIFKCPTYYLTEKLAQFLASNKVYFYELTYNNILSGCHSEQWKGVCHSDDIAFVFGYISENRSQFFETDYEFTLMVNKIWTNFAKNEYNFRGIKIKLSISWLLFFSSSIRRNPLSQSVTNTLKENITNWPVFRTTEQSPVSPKVMELNPSKFGHLFDDPYRGNCNGLWKQYFGTD